MTAAADWKACGQGSWGETALLDARYTYDGNGNRTGKEEKFFLQNGKTPTGAVTQYAYDSMNRLTMESRNGLVTTYTYDMAGNRTGRLKGDDREEYRYNSRNKLTERTGMGRRTRCQYDPEGNLTQEQQFIQGCAETRRYTYDAYNRNTEVRGEDFLHKNFYDAEGLRNRTEENGKATDFVYSGDMLYSEKEESGTTERRYILGNEYLGHMDFGQGAEDGNEDSKRAYSYITDEQGSIRYILNADRQIETYQEYSAFGGKITSQGVFSHLGYNSQTEDELTGLTYLRARYYNPAIGRFTQEDVIYDDGFNLYAYCGSNPVIYCDPSGFALLGMNCANKVGGGNVIKDPSRLLEMTREPQDHHIIPAFRGKSKKYADFIKALGIDVNKYTVTISGGKGGMHMNFIHGKGKWNKKWKDFIDNNPNATAKDVFQFAGKMMDDYGISGLPIHPYRK